MSKKMDDVNQHLPKKPTIAIVGINGTLGIHVINALTSAPFDDKISLPIHLATKQKTNKPASGQFKYFEVSPQDSAEALSKVFSGADIVIDLTDSDADHIKILNAAVLAKDPKVFIASEYGIDNDETSYHIFDKKRAVIKAAKEANMKTVSICTGLFADYAIESPLAFGVSLETGTATIIDNGDTPVSVSFVTDIGKVIASVVTTPIGKLPAKLHVQSDVTTARQVIDIYEAASGKKLKVSRIGLGDARTQAHEIDKMGVKSTNDSYMILQTIGAEGKGANFSRNNHNQDVNPDLFEWTSFEQRAKMAWKNK
ncbi:NAD(P)-binding protein [Nadsonia fulvescens var. elongata DSM 6958]|uniref:NAD(P)-binding protein n=1 Tax=Nadsonia fulvescens var. elongata DSM 6958 TaxID=857566 RepID=A0A1E3PGE0_9ASCO|nr:NAD(P)-binding protein [Nadsonia fulvescens var. elongata DSM 6958]